jgi:hypothetical protein
MTPTDRTGSPVRKAGWSDFVRERVAAVRATLHGRRNRSWYQSIAGKLLLAFGLIVALTVGATWLSLIRFDQVDAVMHRLTDASLPAVKLALGVESTAKDVIGTAISVGQAGNETERSQKMDTLSNQMTRLWAGLGELRAIVGDNATTSKLWEVVSSIDSVVYELNETTSDLMSLGERRRRAIDQLDATTRQAIALADSLAASGAAGPARADLRADLAAAANTLYLSASVESAEALR